ncbi:Transcription initiation factor IIA large subunit [Cytospora mali]|uniref:Transcription initiation factor IIA large subunit n=1 Tax=Cytospora mali TaxID=578113 RepID=A0A194W2U7_CYTMA|nr:Transcription initiation factor IIA large subunit [Valsa mali]
MSNNLVGTIYQQIINEVIETSRVDFEDQGVGEDVLDELRRGWQLKLSKLQVASFPWDPPPPTPAPAPVAQQAPPAPPAPAQPAHPAHQAHQAQQQAGTPSYTSATLSPQPAPNAQPPPLPNGLPGPPQNYNGHQMNPEAGMKQESVVKQEPGLANAGMPPAHPGNNMPQYPGMQGGAGGVAAQRAAAQLQNQYGSRAAASISAIHGFNQGGQPQGQQMPPRPAAPNQPGQAQRPQQAQQAQQAQAQYNQQVANQVAAMAQQRGVAPPHPGQQNGFQQSQTDGAVDGFEGVLMRQNANGETSELGRVDIDRMLHKEMAARANQMEGGGLMLPLKEATKHKSIVNATKSSSDAGPSKFDGVDDEIKREEEDEDAINSDLDDPDEVDIADEDDEENMGHIMLCMYDKVQRVKNKWKCTLKDGVLNVNGKDYVFHKATGEYEW